MSMGWPHVENPAIADGAVNVLAYERSGLAGRGCLRTVVRRGIVPGAAASVPPVRETS